MISVAWEAVAVGAIFGGARVVNEPVSLTVRPDSLTPIIRNEYVADALNPVRFTVAVVGVGPSITPGTTGAVNFVANVGSTPYSKLNVVAANPGFTSINTSAD